MNIVRAIWKYMYIGSQRCMRKLLSLPSTIKIFVAKYECFVLAGQNIMLMAFYYHQYIRNNKKIWKNINIKHLTKCFTESNFLNTVY